MKQYSLTLDLRSIFVGVLFTCGLLMSFSFSNPHIESTSGKFQAIAGPTTGYLVINSETGEFVIYRGSYKTPVDKFDFDQIEMHKSFLK